MTRQSSGSSFPGNDRNKNGFGAGALYVHAGDDFGASASWRAGLGCCAPVLPAASMKTSAR